MITPRPSPALLAAVPVPGAPRHTRPAVLTGRWQRSQYETALRYSTLRPQARLVAFVLAHYAARGCGRIPGPDVPGTYRLASATGLSEESARNSLLVLEREGWLRRPGPPAGQARTGPAPIRLTIPAGTPLPHRARDDGAHEHPS